MPTTATGADLLRISAPHVGDPYLLGALVPKNNPNWRGPWDCAELLSWAVYQAAGILYGCNSDSTNPSIADAFTGYWFRDAHKFGKIITVQQAAGIPGAAIQRLAQSGGPGGHIVFSDGHGGTIEAHSKVDGVIRGKLVNRRWDFGVLVPGIDYDPADAAAVDPAQPPVVFRLLPQNMEGPAVKAIQQALEAAGFDPGDIDGAFGPHTAAAVLAFQAARGLVHDGEVGPATAAALGVTLPSQ